MAKEEPREWGPPSPMMYCVGQLQCSVLFFFYDHLPGNRLEVSLLRPLLSCLLHDRGKKASLHSRLPIRDVSVVGHIEQDARPFAQTSDCRRS